MLLLRRGFLADLEPVAEMLLDFGHSTLRQLGQVLGNCLQQLGERSGTGVGWVVAAASGNVGGNFCRLWGK